jgi:hypothetical protein
MQQGKTNKPKLLRFELRWRIDNSLHRLKEFLAKTGIKWRISA